MIGSSLFIKVCDFGESYCEKIMTDNEKQNFRPARTLPYCAPEILEE